MPCRSSFDPSSAPARGLRAGALAVLLAGGCVLAPEGFEGERRRVETAGAAYEEPHGSRDLPELPARPTWRDLLGRAFLAHGDLEAAYFEWRAAVERVAGIAAWPNTNLMPSFSYMFSDASMKSWDRTSINVGFDGSENLELPVKTRKAAEVALQEARAAAERFRAAKFALQRRVLDAWLDVALAEERVRIASADLGLLRALADTAVPRVRSGGPQQDLVRAQIEVREAENRVLGLEAHARAMRAMLNGLLAREPDAPLDLGAELPEPRPLPGDDAALLAAGVAANPELAALARQVAGRENALELARLRFLPNFVPFAGFTGSVSQMAGVAVMLPTTLTEIRSGIAEAHAMLAEARALARQAAVDRAAGYVAGLLLLRNAEREAGLLAKTLVGEPATATP